jgi:hypothetical protein
LLVRCCCPKIFEIIEHILDYPVVCDASSGLGLADVVPQLQT